MGQVEEQALVRLELLQQGDHLLAAAQLLRVLLRNLDHHLQVGPRVHRQQLVQALQRPVRAQAAEELDQGVGRDGVRVDHHPLDVRKVRVVLQRAAVQPRLLAQLGDAGGVVVGERPLGQDGVRDGGELQEVDLQHLGLQRPVLRQVGLERLKQEAGGLPHHGPLQEEVRHSVNVAGRGALLRRRAQRQLQRRRGVHSHRAGQHVHHVGRVPRLLAVGGQLVSLASRGQGGGHLAVGPRPHVHLQRRLRPVGPRGKHHVPQLLRALQLLLRQPRVQQGALVLLQHQLGQLEGLEAVQLAPGQALPEVDQQRRLGAHGGGGALEAGHCLPGAQDAAGR